MYLLLKKERKGFLKDNKIISEKIKKTRYSRRYNIKTVQKISDMIFKIVLLNKTQ